MDLRIPILVLALIIIFIIMYLGRRKLMRWYYELDETCKIEKKDEPALKERVAIAALKGSGVEIVIFYLSMLTTLIFCLITWFPSLAYANTFEFKFSLFLIPLAIWMFLRNALGKI